MSLVGSAQWSISIGRFDIQSAIMTMSKFRSAPRKGYLERMKRVIGYLCKYWHYMIYFCVDKPEYSNVPGIKNHDGNIRSTESTKKIFLMMRHRH